MNKNEIEEKLHLNLDYQKTKKINNIDVIPVVVQDIESKEVLLLAYANQIALDHSLQNKVATFWSTSRNELWVKGKTSGEYLDMQEIRINCEQNSLLYLVKVRSNGACHTKNKEGLPRFSCFYRKLKNNKSLGFISQGE